MRKYDFVNDKIAKACLVEAEKGKSYIGFGAVLVRDGIILTRGRNRRSNSIDRSLLSHVDYAIHAEQDVVSQALQKGISLEDTEIYVLGKVLRGENVGTLTIRTDLEFGCIKCPHTFIRFGIPIIIPHITGWVKLSPEESLKTGVEFKKSLRNWKKFSEGVFS